VKGSSFLFLGPELGEKSDALTELKKRLGEQAEVTSFYAGETPVSQIVDIVKNGSLFCDARLFIIKNAEAVKKKDETELLAACLENPGEGVSVVLFSDETRLDKRLEDAVPRANKRVFWELFESKKSEWVASFFRREGCRIAPDGVEAVLELVENNTDALRRECARLILFLGKDRPVGAADVEQCLSHTREESAFTLFAALARGNLAGSLEIARALLGAKQSVQTVLAGLAWCFRKLDAYLALKEGGNMNDFEMKKIGLGSLRMRADYAEAARRWNSAGALLALTGEYEYLFRSSGAAFEGILMDSFMYRLAGPAPRRGGS
jgi:DNA polymerase-3 subunit delta